VKYIARAADATQCIVGFPDVEKRDPGALGNLGQGMSLPFPNPPNQGADIAGFDQPRRGSQLLQSAMWHSAA
jgi:hypothetical protein